MFRDISESRIILVLLSEMQLWQRGQSSTRLPMQTPQNPAAHAFANTYTQATSSNHKAETVRGQAPSGYRSTSDQD